MQLEGLLQALEPLALYRALLERLGKASDLADQHVLRAARPFVSAALAHDLSRPVLLVTARVERAYNVAEQLPVWLSDRPVLRFAEPSSLFYERSPWAAATIRSRLDVLATLCPPIGAPVATKQVIASQGDHITQISPPGSPSPFAERGPGGEVNNGHSKQQSVSAPVIVTSALALMQRTLPVREFRASSRILKRDQQAEPDKLLRTWLGIGYVPASVVAEPGTFNRRGGIVDVFPINADRPVRIEFFGDTIESLRIFDPSTQRSSEHVEQLAIYPAHEALPRLSPDVAEHLHDWFAQQPLPDEDVTSARPDEEALRSGSAFPLIEFYLPYFYSNTASLLDYLPENTLVIVEDWGALSTSTAQLEAQDLNEHEEKRQSNEVPPHYPLPYFTWDELHETLVERQPLHLGSTSIESRQDDLDQPPIRIGDSFAPGPHYGGDLRPPLG